MKVTWVICRRTKPPNREALYPAEDSEGTALPKFRLLFGDIINNIRGTTSLTRTYSIAVSSS
ncbi:MAG TPA: hypothetical protein VKR57_05460 [Terriglobales bacterium]|nr:hypothetical protein [Terriglobales bacterium]